MSPNLPSPWSEFLAELDALLDEPIELHCIGGFAVVAGYCLTRGTNDLDYRSPRLSKLGFQSMKENRLSIW